MLNRVQESREANGQSLEELAAAVGVSPRFLASLEAGETVPGVDVAVRLARALGVVVENLFAVSDPETPREEPAPDASAPAAKDVCPEDVLSEEESLSESVDSHADVPVVETAPEPLAHAVEVEDPVAEVSAPVADAVSDAPESAPAEKRSAAKKPRRCRKDKPAAEPDSAKSTAAAGSADDVLTPEAEPVAPYLPRALDEQLFSADGEPLFGDVSADGVGAVPAEGTRRVFAPRKSQTISSYYSRTAEEEGLAASPAGLADPTADRPVRYFDLFCGIGGFRYAAESALKRMGREGECVLSCDIDPHAQESYAANFGDRPVGDVSRLPSEEIPDFDLLFAGFPCQTFSIIGLRKGFADETKGSLFFQIARILRDKRPRAFVLENVRQLTTHDNGRTFEVILRALQDELGYYVDWRVLNALDCGLPQKRERVVVVGSTEPFEMEWPRKTSNAKSLKDILEPEDQIPDKFKASPEIVQSRKKAHQSKYYPAVWHENKSGFVSSYPYSCALRAGASHNYLLVNGERRFTPLELLRLQGFPDDFKIAVSYTQLRKQVGNAAPVNLVERALERFLPLVFQTR